ncbi:hypothetical protein AC068_18055 [Morganella morganii]|uniref:WYL domain-containing protein n=1 Tax=Morganella morganii TaxID=582 RepID=UPI0006C3BCAC|nr:WYL domain-containing protein [Morganella morganii]KOO17325.1 hypothetical protein AC068_18055 [Morganella morganii]
MKKLISALKILVLVILGFFLLAWIAIIFDKKASQEIPAVALLICTAIPMGIFIYLWYIKKPTPKPTESFGERTRNEFERIKAQTTDRDNFPPRTISDFGDDTVDPPIPSNDYVMVNGEALIWEGSTKPASVKIRDERDKKHGIFTRMVIREDGEFYLSLTDPESGEDTEIRETEIQTAITVGKTRYDFVELCRRVFGLELHELFEYTKAIRYEAKEPKLIAEFPAIPTTFTYLSGSGKNRRTVDITEYKRNGYGDEYIAGYCHLRNEYRNFAVSRIQTMLASEGHPKYHFHDWLENIVKASNT